MKKKRLNLTKWKKLLVEKIPQFFGRGTGIWAFFKKIERYHERLGDRVIVILQWYKNSHCANTVYNISPY